MTLLAYGIHAPGCHFRVDSHSTEDDMRNRRDFIRNAAGATAGLLMSGHPLADAALGQVGAPPGKRREVSIGGRRVKTVDVHAHWFVPEVWEVVKNTPLAEAAKANLTGNIALGNPQRLIDMDAQGIDYQAININAWGYSADRALARDVVALQNQKISEWVAKHPDRFVGMASLALQHPDLAAEQLDQAVKKLGLRGAAIGGSVEGQELSDRKFDPVLGKGRGARRAAVHAPAAGARHDAEPAAAGERWAGQHHWQSARDDRVPLAPDLRGDARSLPGPQDLRGARRRLPGVVQRPIGCLVRRGGAGADCKALKKKPSEYFKRELFVDTMIFHEEGCGIWSRKRGRSDGVRNGLSLRLARRDRLRPQRAVRIGGNAVSGIQGRPIEGKARTLRHDSPTCAIRRCAADVRPVHSLPASLDRAVGEPRRRPELTCTCA